MKRQFVCVHDYVVDCCIFLIYKDICACTHFGLSKKMLSNMSKYEFWLNGFADALSIEED